MIERKKSKTSQRTGLAPQWFSVTEPYNKTLEQLKADYQSLFANGEAQAAGLQFDGLQDAQQITERLDDLETAFWETAYTKGEKYYFGSIVDNQQRSNWKGFLNTNPFKDNVPDPVDGEPDYEARKTLLQGYRKSVTSAIASVVLHTMCHPEIQTHLINQCGSNFNQLVEAAELEHWQYIREELISMGGIHDLHRTMAVDQQFQKKNIRGNMFRPWVAHLKQQTTSLAQALPAREVVMPDEAVGQHRKYSETQMRTIAQQHRMDDLRRIVFSMNIGVTTPPALVRYLTMKKVGLGANGSVSFDELESISEIHVNAISTRLWSHRNKRNQKRSNAGSASKSNNGGGGEVKQQRSTDNDTTLATITGTKRDKGGRQRGPWCHHCQTDGHYTRQCKFLSTCSKCKKKHTKEWDCQRKRGAKRRAVQ